MWIIQKNAVPDEIQDSEQGLQNRFRSGEMAYPTISKQIDGILSIIIRGFDRWWYRMAKTKYHLGGD